MINDGFCLDLGEYLCGCPYGGVGGRTLKVSYTSRGILQYIFVSDRSDFGTSGIESNTAEYEQILDESFYYSAITLRKLTKNWRNSYFSDVNFITQYNLMLFSTGIFILIIFIRKTKKQ